MKSGLQAVIVLFVISFVVGYVVTRERSLATSVQAALLLGFVLSITPLAVSQFAKLVS